MKTPQSNGRQDLQEQPEKTIDKKLKKYDLLVTQLKQSLLALQKDNTNMRKQMLDLKHSHDVLKHEHYQLMEFIKRLMP